jgi:ATP-dependent DNA helicase RecG
MVAIRFVRTKQIMANKQVQLGLFDAVPPKFWSPDRIFNVIDPYDLESVGESQVFERKPVGIHARDLAKWIAAWSIVKPDGGVIAVGVNDDGTLQGCSSADPAHINRLEQVRDYCPDARIEMRQIHFRRKDDGELDCLILIRVKYRADKLVRTTDNKAFRREGDAKKQLSDDEAREIECDIGQVSFEQEPCNLAYPDDFDLPAIHTWARRATAENRWADDTSDEQAMANLNLGKIRPDSPFIPNIACALLFANNPQQVIPGCRVHLLKFRGETEGTGETYTPLKDEFVSGTIPQIIVRVEQWIDSQLRNFTRLGQDGRFFTGPEYPKLAWYEAIVNACVHRSYSLRNMCTTVKLFEDRMEVQSPGAFPPFVTAQNIYEITSHPRNPHLFHAMWYLEYVRCNNEGTKRMRDKMRGNNLPPPEFREHEQDFVCVKVTLRNDIQHRKLWVDEDAAALIGKALFEGLTDDERRIINYVAEFNSANVSIVQRLTQSSWPHSKQVLAGLVEKRILRHLHKPGDDRDPQAYFVLFNAPADTPRPKRLVKRKPKAP